MKFVWNGLCITAIEPSLADYLQSLAEDVEYEDVSEKECKMIETNQERNDYDKRTKSSQELQKENEAAERYCP